MAITDLLNKLPPSSRRWVLIAAAGGAVALVLKGRSSDEPDPDAEDAGVQGDDGSGGAGGFLPVDYSSGYVGADQLAEFESNYAQMLAALAEQVGKWDQPHGSSSQPVEPAGTVHMTYVMTLAGGKGESANDIAIRLRHAGAKTASNQAITAAYLIRFNQWPGNATQQRWPGTRVAY